ncbi:MAG: NUDIX domain-containing protein [Bacteroidetes bacterium]|nr:MAG: NUDIX domain-containing protein [Bacteroidota bacterium]
MKNTHSEEIFPIVDEEGNTIGEAFRSVCHNGKSMLLHPVVHLHVFNSSGELFLQKRSVSKDIQPGKWDTSVGGHISPGESVTDALTREADEELGMKNFIPVFAGRYVWKSDLERELVNSYTTTTDEVPAINQDEIDEGRYWSMDEIKREIGKDIFTPNFEYEFKVLLSPSDGCRKSNFTVK